GDDMLAALDRLEHQVLGHRVAADQLNDDIDVPGAHHFVGVAQDARLLADFFSRDFGRLVGDLRDLDGAPGAAADLVGVAVEYVPGAAADRADPEQPYADRLHAAPRSNPSFLNMSLMP